jgi:DNA polymerase III subunit beta
MDLVVLRSEILRELQLVQGIVERKSSVPMLSNVLLDARDGRLSISATDLDVSLRCGCAARVIEPGALTLGAKKLYEISRSLPESDVHIRELPDSWVAIECEKVSFKVAGLPKDDYPALPEADGPRGTALPGVGLRDLIARTSFTITAEDARYFLGGALLVVDDEGFAVVSTDGHRLAYARRQISLAGMEPVRVLIPRKAVHEMGRLLDDGGDVYFRQSGGHLLFSVGERLLSSKMIEGQFPAYEKVVGVRPEHAAIVETEAFAAALRRVSLLSPERTRAVRLVLGPGSLELLASSPELGEARDAVAAEYSGEGVDIAFNGQYLLDFLGVVGTEKVSIGLRNSESQGILTPAGETEVDYRYVVMPMRL